MLLCEAAISQTENLRFQHLTTEDGLSEGVVYCILQDTKGFLWFGTNDGLDRYDGYSITAFKNKPYDSLSLIGSQVITLLEDKYGGFWVGTQKGLHRFDSETETFQRYQHHPQKPTSITQNDIHSLCEDSSGNIWIGTGNGLDFVTAGSLGSSSKQSITFQHITNGFLETKSKSNVVVRSLTCNSSGTVWIGTYSHLYSFHPGDTAVTHVYTFQDFFGNPAQANVMCEFPRGTLWIGMMDELFRYEISTGNIISVQEFHSASANEKTVRAILPDHEGNLWFATHAGLYKLNKELHSFQRFTHIPTDTRTLSKERLYALCQDRSGVLWVGTFGTGVDRTNLIRKQFQHFRVSSDSKMNMVTSLFEDQIGHVWFSDWEHGLFELDRKTNISNLFNISQELNGMTELDDENILFAFKVNMEYIRDQRKFIKSQTTSVSSFVPDGEAVWFTDGASLKKFNFTTNELLKEFPVSMFEGTPSPVLVDSKGILWISQSGLWSLNPETREMKRYRYDPNNLKSISSESITSMCEDDAGMIWIGTREGLNRFDRKDETFTHYFEKDGLPNDVIYGILKDETGSLWMSTNRGLSRLNPATGTFRNFDVDDGLQANEFNAKAFFKSNRGEMFFGGVNGFNSFFPNEIKDNPHIPSIVLTDFRVFNETRTFDGSFSTLDAITLQHDENFFSFEFAALDFANQKKNKYKYKLDGFDENWVNAGTRRIATYTDVHPGKYIFRVKGSNNDDVWNEEGLTISVTIVPPFWATWWFRFFVGIVIIALGPIVYYRRINVLKREKKVQEEFSRQLIESQERERKRIAAALHDSLGQNIIISKNHAMMGLKVSNEQTSKEHLTEISSLLSQSLDEVREIAYNLRPYHLDRIGLTRTIEFIIHKVKSSTTIECLTDIEHIDKLLPSEGEISLYRIVQESINNVVKHSGATQLKLTIQTTAQYLHVEISDNGRGFDTESFPVHLESKSGFGLTGIAERVRLLNGTLSFNSIKEKGTTLLIDLPVDCKQINKQS